MYLLFAYLVCLLAVFSYWECKPHEVRELLEFSALSPAPRSLPGTEPIFGYSPLCKWVNEWTERWFDSGCPLQRSGSSLPREGEGRGLQRGTHGPGESSTLALTATFSSLTTDQGGNGNNGGPTTLTKVSDLFKSWCGLWVLQDTYGWHYTHAHREYVRLYAPPTLLWLPSC